MQMQRVRVSLWLSVGAVVLGLLCGSISLAQAQEPPLPVSMEARLRQVLTVLQESEVCEAIEAALDLTMEILYGGMRPLPSKNVPPGGQDQPLEIDILKQTQDADEAIRANELEVASVLEKFVQGGRCPEQTGRALDLKLLIEEISEVALAVGKVTARCGQGNHTQEEACNELQPLLNEQTGREFLLDVKRRVITPRYVLKLRSPAVPPWIRRFQEDVRVTGPIPPFQCSVVFKEFKGLMFRLVYDRVIVVTDPWVAVFGVPRGTRIPIWRLEWVPSQYVKSWHLCNKGGRIVMTESQRVKQDIPLNFFWRFYPKDP